MQLFPLRKSLIFLLIGLVSLIISSCGTSGVPTVVFKEATLSNSTQSTQTKGNIEISVTPLKPSNMYKFPNLFSFSSNNLPQSINQFAVDSYFPEDYQKTRWNYVFAPGNNILTVFRVKIKNNTSHILRMKDARVYLVIEGQDPIPAVNKLGNTVLVQTTVGKDQVLLPKSYVDNDGSLVDWVTREEENFERTRQKGLIDVSYPIGISAQTIAQNQRSYNLINDVSREILPETTFNGILLFPIYTSSFQEAKLMFYDITTKTDAAGNPTEKVTFEFPIKVIDQQMWFDRNKELRWKVGVPNTTASQN